MPLANLYKYTETVLAENKNINLYKYFENIIKIQKIKYKVRYEQKKIPSLPTLIFVNHFVRPVFIRKSLFTTAESLYTSALVSVCFKKLLKRKLIWIVKQNINTHFLGFKFPVAKYQSKLVKKFDFITTNNNYPFSNEKEIMRKLISGYNIALYPEGKPSFRLNKPANGFKHLHAELKNCKLKYQILPVSIYYKNNAFTLIFGKAIKPDLDPHLTLDQIMQSITQNLPHNQTRRAF